jgi:lipid-A-disaccharide synthase-like uncharacterized protein
VTEHWFGHKGPTAVFPQGLCTGWRTSGPFCREHVMESKLTEILSQGIGPWEVIGFLGLAVFSSRFIVQWIASERRKESVIPVSFWYLSIVGSLFLLAYALSRLDPVFILSYLFNGLIYGRNLYFVYSKKNQAIAK